MNIVLIGMRGSGKTTVAKELASLLNRQYFDTDEYIEKTTKTTIQEIVDTEGWDSFRATEVSAVKAMSGMQDVIIATGGGVILNQDNIDALKSNGKIVYLKAPVPTLLQRTAADKNRPALKEGLSREEEMFAVYEERKELYASAADVIIDTTIQSPKEIAKEIITQLWR